MKSDKSFLEFIKSSDKMPVLGIVFILGICFILIGNLGFKGNLGGEEDKVEKICSMIDGVGECRVIMTYREVEGVDSVYAVTVLCEGAESVGVCRDITEMISSLYGIGYNRVEIFLLEEK